MHALDVLKYGNLTLLRSVHKLPEADWRTPNVCGYWSVKDIIAHLASFEHALIDVLGVARGEPMGPTLAAMMRDGQAFNDTEVPARAALSPAETLAEYEATHARVMELAAALPAECFRDDGGRCAIERCCRLRGVLGEAVDAFHAVLDRYTLADLARSRSALVRTLGIRPAERAAP